MSKYIVYSGKLTIVVLAETAYDAAVEALQWWGDRPSETNAGTDGADSTLQPVIEIRIKDGFVEDLKLTVGESGNAMRVSETVRLSFTDIEFRYYFVGDRSDHRREFVRFSGHTGLH